MLMTTHTRMRTTHECVSGDHFDLGLSNVACTWVVVVVRARNQEACVLAAGCAESRRMA